jgi:hypothetical protein
MMINDNRPWPIKHIRNVAEYTAIPYDACANVSRRMVDGFMCSVRSTKQNADACYLPHRCWKAVMGLFVPILDQSNKLTCAICEQPFRSGTSRFEGGRKVAYLCRSCAESSRRSVILPGQPGDPASTSLRINAWPIFAICLSAIGTVAVVLMLNGLGWIVLRAMHLF